MRVDKWLWTARVFKTRGLAAEAAKGGRVLINDVTAKPSREVAVGDRIEVTLGTLHRTVIVRGAAQRRVPPAEVVNLYEETAASVAERERFAEERRLGAPTSRGARPTKRDRRRFDAGQY
jgi:ribosome-associated heat shock protein Hsp15